MGLDTADKDSGRDRGRNLRLRCNYNGKQCYERAGFCEAPADRADKM